MRDEFRLIVDGWESDNDADELSRRLCLVKHFMDTRGPLEHEEKVTVEKMAQAEKALLVDRFGI